MYIKKNKIRYGKKMVITFGKGNKKREKVRNSVIKGNESMGKQDLMKERCSKVDWNVRSFI